MGKKSAPPAPDYTGAANAQAQGSQNLAADQTMANRPNVSTPWGSQTWSSSVVKDPVTGRDQTQWNQNVQLAPDQQAALDSQMRIQAGQSGAAEGLLGQVAQNFNSPMDWNSLPSRAGNVTAGTTTNFTGNPRLPNTAAPGPAFSFGGAPGVSQLQTGVDAQELQTGVNTRQLQTGLAGNSGDYRQKAQDAVWDLQKPMLDQQQSDLENQLVNQGFARDSEGFGREMTRMGDIRSRAQLAAIDSGRAEAGQMFNQDLSAGQFGNQAQNQMFSQDLSAGQFGNQSKESMFAQMLQSGQFGNQAMKDMFSQGMDTAQFQNQTRAQDFSEGMAGANFENIASQGEFDNLMRSAQMGDQQAQQRLQMAMSAGNFNNTNRQQAIAEGMTQRSQPLNELNALLSGNQVNNPQFPNFMGANAGQTANLSGAANDQYGAALDAFNAKNGATNQLSSAAMTAAMAYFMSDVRLKENIRQIGTLKNGLRVYEFQYRGLPLVNIGVMAQEVREITPDAVAFDGAGYMMVDYSKVAKYA